MDALCAASASARSSGSARLLICREREWLFGKSRTFTSVILPPATTTATLTAPNSLDAEVPFQVPLRSPRSAAFVGVAFPVGARPAADGARPAADGARDAVAEADAEEWSSASGTVPGPAGWLKPPLAPTSRTVPVAVPS